MGQVWLVRFFLCEKKYSKTKFTCVLYEQSRITSKDNQRRHYMNPSDLSTPFS
jgi:hypothetical protein